MNELDARHIDEFSALLAVAREGSIVGAGPALQRHASIVSKRLTALEQRLGVRLLERTTRRVRLTEAGNRLRDRLRNAGQQIQEAEQEASATAVELRGKLRLALPASMGRIWLAPLLPSSLRLYPTLEVETHFSEQHIDLVAEGFDFAIRIGVLNDSRLIVKRLGQTRRVLCASPEYIQRHGMPTTPRQLHQHNCLKLTTLASFPEWRLSNGSKKELVEASSTLSSNDVDALLEAAVAGIGIFGAGEWLMTREFAAGRLVPVLPDWSLDAESGVYLVRPSLRFAPARTEAFVAWMPARTASGRA